MTTNKKPYMRDYHEDHRRRGLCIYCTKPTKDNYTRCQYHLDKAVEYRNTFLQRKKSREKVTT